MGAKRTSSIRTSAVVAVVAALGLTACAPTPEPVAAPPSRVVVSTVGDLTSFNPTSAHGATDVNRMVAGFLGESFAYLDDDLQVAVNEGFGKVELVSQDPLRVVYTLNEGRAWSDGTPVTTDDLVFGWAVTSGYLDDAAYDDHGTVISGTRYFDAATPPEGFRETRVPRVDRVKGTVTLTYDEPFADWNRQWLLDRPVHVVAERAGVTVRELIDAIRDAPKGDPAAPVAPNPVLLAAAQAWNTGFDVDPASPDLTAAVSNGPYVADGWSAHALTLVRNRDYQGEHHPSFDEVVIRFFDSAQEERSALQRGEVDVANVEDLSPAAVDALTDAGVTALPSARSRALSLVFSDQGPWADVALREALIAAVDRDGLVEEIQREVYSDAQPLQSFLSSRASGDIYQDIVSNNASSGFPAADPARAEELLEGRSPVLRVGYDPSDPLADELVSEITAMAAVVGIEVTAADGVAAPDATIVSTDTSRSLFNVARQWISLGFGGADAAEAFVALRESLDPERAVEFAQQIDRVLIEQRAGLPLLSATGAVVHSDRVAGVTSTGWDWGMPRQFWTWTPQ